MNAVSIGIAFAAISVGSLIKGITGLGLPIVAMPVLGYLLGVPHAIGILVIPIIATNLLQVVQMRAEMRRNPFLWPLLGCGMIGIGIGTWLLTVLSAERINLFLGLSLLFYIAMRILAPQLALSRRAGWMLAPPVGLLAGIAQGATGLCAAVFVPYIHSLGLSRPALIFSVSLGFLFFALIQLTTLLAIGLIEPRHLLEGVGALVPVAIFMPAGAWLARRMPRKVFDAVFLCVMAAVAVGLIRSGLR